MRNSEKTEKLQTEKNNNSLLEFFRNLPSIGEAGPIPFIGSDGYSSDCDCDCDCCVGLVHTLNQNKPED